MFTPDHANDADKSQTDARKSPGWTCKNQENMTQKGEIKRKETKGTKSLLTLNQETGNRGNLQMGELLSAANVSEGETNAV